MYVAFHLVLGGMSEIDYIFKFRGVADHVLLARTLFQVPRENINDQISPTHYAQFQFYPIFIRIMATLTCNNAWFGIPILTLIQSGFFSYCVLFMMISFKCSSSPIISTYVSTFYPVGMILLRNVALPHTLSLSFVCLAFGYFRRNHMKLAALFCFLASITSFEGFLCPITLLICSLLNCHILTILYILAAISGAVSMLFGLNYYMYGNPFAFVNELANKFSPTLFSSVYLVAKSRPIACIFGTLIGFLLPSSIGTIRLLTKSRIHFVYCLLAFIMLAFFDTLDFENFGCGMALFAVVIGCDEYIHFVFGVITNKYIVLLLECIIIGVASRGIKFHGGSSEYMEYAFSDTVLSDV